MQENIAKFLRVFGISGASGGFGHCGRFSTMSRTLAEGLARIVQQAGQPCTEWLANLHEINQQWKLGQVTHGRHLQLLRQVVDAIMVCAMC